jgi:aspartyl-tRNA(Asn)/glutamyl-tRNA(Gln) amidotransferase subunit A
MGVCPNVLTFDHLGPMTRTALDAAFVLQALAGYDPRDPASRDVPVPDYTADLSRGVRGLRLVLCPDFYMNAELDLEVEYTFSRGVQVFRHLGATVDIVSFPDGGRLAELFRRIAGPEFAEFHRPFFAKNPEGYGAEVRERLEWSFNVTVDEYVRALREREILRRKVTDFFLGIDALLLPSMPCAAAPIETLMAKVNGKEHHCMWIHRPFLTPHNVTGCPAVSVLMGFNQDEMPLSLQIVGPEWSEERILAIAKAYEDATPDFRTRRPPCI